MPDAPRRAERTLLELYLWMRSYHLAAAIVSLWVDRRRYRRPRLADAAFVGVLAESLWAARRCSRRGAYNDRFVATVDTITGCVGLVACALAVEPDDQFNPINWMFPLTVFDAVAANAGFDRRAEAAVAATALAGTYAFATASQTSGSRRPAMFGVWQYVGCLIAGDILLRRTRANAEEIVVTQRAAVVRARRVAEERERTRLHAELHAGALRALEQVRGHWPADRERARVIARREAIRLRRALRGEDLLQLSGLRDRLEDVTRELAASGLRVDLVVDELEREPAGDVTDALAEAVDAALRNVVRHSGELAAVVRVVEVEDALEITVRDRGRGDARTTVPEGVASAARRAGADVVWWSVPGRGARVTIRVPA